MNNKIEELKEKIISEKKRKDQEKEMESLRMNASFVKRSKNQLYFLYKSYLKKRVPRFVFRLYNKLHKLWRKENRFKKIAKKIKPENLKIDQVEALVFKKNEKPDVSVIILGFNKWQYSYSCLKSLVKNTSFKLNFEVIFIDNNSSDETPELAKKVKNLVYVRNEDNLGFVGGCNQGAKIAKGKFLVFLNNDTFVLPGWLSKLVETLKKDDSIGLVGSKLVYPDGKLQEAGGIVWQDKNAWNFGNGGDPGEFQFNYLKDVDYCSGASLAIKKELFFAVGGFDEIYAPAFFEDTDLAFKVRKAGKRTVYQPKSELIHFEGVTAGKNVKKGFKQYQETNKQKFFERWGVTLKKENFKEDLKNVFLARDRSKNKKILLYIDNNVPTFDQDAGSFITLEYLKILKKIGYKIIFWPHNRLKITPYSEHLEELGVETVYGDPIFLDFLKENGEFFDLAIVARPNVGKIYIPLLKKYSKAKIIYMAHDLHFLREEREQKFKEKKSRAKEKTQKEELQLMKESDLTWVFSSVEEKIIKKIHPEIKIETIPWIEEIKEESEKMKREGVMFLGGFNHPPNQDAVLWFFQEILPLVKKTQKNLKVTVIGSHPPKEIEKLNSSDFEILGFVSDPDLEKFLLAKKLFIAPLRFGAGFKGKIAKAMAHGLPVVSTSIGAEGMNLKDGKTALLADDPQEFAQKIQQGLSDQNLWEKIALKSVDHVRENYSSEKAEEKVRAMFEGFNL